MLRTFCVKHEKEWDEHTRSFQAGDKVLVLIPMPGSAIQAKFAGPYEIKEKFRDTDYIVETPDRKRKSRISHINMLKAYVSRSGSDINLIAMLHSKCKYKYIKSISNYFKKR